MRKLLITLCVSFFSQAFSQTDSLKDEPYVYFNAFSVSLGFIGNAYEPHSPDDLKKLTSRNSVVNSNFKDYEQLESKLTGNVRLNTGFNFHLKTKDFKTGKTRFSSEWRVGLYIGTLLKEKIRYSVKTDYAFDTIYSGNPTETVHVEVERDQRYQFSITGKQAYADITKTYHTDQLKLVSYYTGINFGIGYTFDNKLEAVTAPGEPSQRVKRPGDLRTYPNAMVDRTSLPSELFYNTTIPVGAMMRLSNTRTAVAHKIALTAEVRFGYRFDDHYNHNFNPTFVYAVQVAVKMYFNNYKID
jgi:hypothetical protein